MVFTYGKFHNNWVNQAIHCIFVPIILYTWYVQMSHAFPIVELGFTIPVFGDKIGGGFWLNVVVSLAYFFIDVKVAIAVAAWWWPVMVFGNWTWML